MGDEEKLNVFKLPSTTAPPSYASVISFGTVSSSSFSTGSSTNQSSGVFTGCITSTSTATSSSISSEGSTSGTFNTNLVNPSFGGFGSVGNFTSSNKNLFGGSSSLTSNTVASSSSSGSFQTFPVFGKKSSIFGSNIQSQSNEVHTSHALSKGTLSIGSDGQKSETTSLISSESSPSSFLTTAPSFPLQTTENKVSFTQPGSLNPSVSSAPLSKWSTPALFTEPQGTTKSLFGGISSTTALTNEPSTSFSRVSSSTVPSDSSLTKYPFSSTSTVPTYSSITKSSIFTTPKFPVSPLLSKGTSLFSSKKSVDSSVLNPFAAPFEPSSKTSTQETKAATEVLFGKKEKSDEVLEDADSIIQNILQESLSPTKVDEPSKPLSPETKQSTVIVALNVDPNYLDKTILKNHFKKFGLVKSVYISKKTNQVSISYYDHESAAAAKEKGKKIHPKTPEMKLLYGSTMRKRLTSDDTGKDVADQLRKKAVRYIRQASQDAAQDTSSSKYPFKSKTRVSPRNEKSSKISSKRHTDELTPSGRSITDYSNLFDEDQSEDERRRRRGGSRDRLSDTSRRIRAPDPMRSSVRRQPFRSDRRIKNFDDDSREHSKIKKKNNVKLENKNESRLKTTSLDDIITTRQIGKVDTSSIVSTEKDYSLNTQAVTDNDKYNILKARDKHLRTNQEKVYDVSKAKYLSATCPDMCPEKERYMRKVQCDLSSLELTNKEIDHRLMIKKFSRSSADKDEPLPHELRPGPVLLRTMDFLICNIVERCNEPDLEDDLWYNFLWNRTRGLRNDISQQHLVDANAVLVLERCTRFHIHCAERFCDVAPDIFDPKMNTEHLAKSLQTLKELYYDLAEKGITFESESEFRCYEVLLNVNDGNIIMKCIHFREEVKNSQPVQFAVKVLRALQSRSYVKFFKYVREATYLQACILHRYFNYVRGEAIGVMLKAYGGPKKQTVPISEIIDLLGFENNLDAVGFFSHYNFPIKDDCVVMDNKSANLLTTEKPPTCRPVNLVETKYTGTIGEIIQGGPLPSNPLFSHRPHNSFTEDGYLKEQAKDASDQSNTSTSSSRLTSDDNKTEEESPVVKISANIADTIKQMMRQSEEVKPIQVEKKLDPPRQISIFGGESSVLQPPQPLMVNFDHQMIEVCNDIVNEIVTEEATYIAYNVLENTPLEELLDESIFHFVALQVKRRHFEAWKNYTKSKKEVQEIEKEVKKLVSGEVLNKWKDKVIKFKHAEELRRNRQQNMVHKYFHTWKENTKRASIFRHKLNRIHERVLARSAINQWKRLVYRAREHNSIITHTKCTIVSDILKTWKEKVDLRQKDIRARDHYTRSLLKSTFDRWRNWMLFRKIRSRSEQECFPATGSQLSAEDQNKMWDWGYKRKAEDDMTIFEITNIENKMKKLCNNFYFERDNVSLDPFPLQQIFQSSIDECHKVSRNLLEMTFKIVIFNKVDYSQVKNNLGTEWIRCKFSLNEDTDKSVPLTSILKLQSKFSGTPYLIVIKEASNVADLEANLNGTNLVIVIYDHEQHYQFKFCKTERNTSSNMIDKIFDPEFCSTDSLLTEHSSFYGLYNNTFNESVIAHILKYWKTRGQTVCLKSNDLYTWTSSFISNKVLVPIYKKQHLRFNFQYSPMDPNAFIAFYNDALNYLANVLNNQEIIALNWPPVEAVSIPGLPGNTWNSEELGLATYNINLATLPKIMINEYKTWNDVRSFLDNFIDQVVDKKLEGFELFTEVNKLFDDACESYVQSRGTEDEEEQLIHHYLVVPWLEIINACISYKLSYLPKIKICFQSDFENDYYPPNSWTVACNTSDSAFYTSPASLKRSAMENPQSQDLTPENKRLKSRLSQDIADEKIKSLEFEAEIKKKLEDGERELKILMEAANLPFLQSNN